MYKYQKTNIDEIYHVFNKSIERFKIFNNNDDFSRIVNVICYYQEKDPLVKFSKYKELQENTISHLRGGIKVKNRIVEIIAYCIMPTHIHLVLKQVQENGISIFMGKVLNSYTKYFNTKYKRKGPLWVGRFKKVPVENDEQLLHLTRYVHLNPVTAYLIDKPEDWIASSYKEYISNVYEDNICKYKHILNIKPVQYKELVDNRISYQRDLAKIKSLLLE